ncbi:MAG: hypothetical protein MJZ28_09130 [Paludibacteraceae bacterium]|nr:hypothetical protein [Paludibacteraceae bacterium]
MKNWKLLFLMCLCALFTVSCSKDDDGENLGDTPIEDIPTGYKKLDVYGMSALFLEESGWSNYTTNEFKNMTGYSAQFNRDCIAAFLKEDSVTFAGHTAYRTVVYFSRFDKLFASESEVNDMIAEYRDVLDGMCDVEGNDPNLSFSKVGEVEFATIGKYTGSLIETLDKAYMYQANYFVYDEETSRLYMVTLSLDEEHHEAADAKYRECLAVVNSLKLTGK